MLEYLLFMLPAFMIMILAQSRVLSTYRKYGSVPNTSRLTGLEAAQKLLEACGLHRVRIEGAPGLLTDHYDPRGKVLRLSRGVARSASVASLGIVAHEIGHALQDKEGYLPLRLRNGLVPLANWGSWLGLIFCITGIIFAYKDLVLLGVIFFSAAVAFALITLPVEFNASKRAKELLYRAGLVSSRELAGVEKVLSAAAFTYVAAFLYSLSQLFFFLSAGMGMGGES